MSGRRAGWAAGGMWAVILLAMVLTLLLAALNEPTSSLRDSAMISLVILAFSTVGALIWSRRPENPIGWLFCSGASLWILGELALEYGVYALITAPGTLPAGAWAAWFGGWARGVGWFVIVAFLLLLFPNGRLPSPRWRPILWGAVAYVGFFTVVTLLSPASNDTRLAFVRNPLGLEIVIIDLLIELLYFTIPLLLVVGAAAVIVRFRHSRGEERQQLKWFAYAVGVMVVLFVLWFSLALTGLVAVGALVFSLPLMGLPVAVGVAILRYRLYDIDLVINRTLVYAALTALLAATYLGAVVLSQGMIRGLTGQETQLAIVASTLLIAALFVPLRRRVQFFIDRRFYRKKYDAARTLRDFAGRLRERTDLNDLNAELLGVVLETVQPEYASLWLRAASRPDRGEAVEQDR